MTVEELIRDLQQIQDKSQNVFYPQQKFIGNMTEVESVQESSYGFFGEAVSCVMLGGELPDEDDE